MHCSLCMKKVNYALKTIKAHGDLLNLNQCHRNEAEILSNMSKNDDVVGYIMQEC